MKSKILKSICLSISFLTVLSGPTFATWSIIVADPKTKEIGIAGASCTMSVYGIGAIVPGKGAIVVQAMSNGLARLQGFRMIMEGASAAAILEKIRHLDYDPEQQQYAILCITKSRVTKLDVGLLIAASCCTLYQIMTTAFINNRWVLNKQVTGKVSFCSRSPFFHTKSATLLIFIKQYKTSTL